MSTILQVSPESSSSVIQRAARCLADGGVLAVGTESSYALAGRALNPDAVSRVARLKGRSFGKPILSLVGEESQLTSLVASVPPAARLCISRFWPGPLTLVLPAKETVPIELTGPTGAVGVRQPAGSFLQTLLRHVGPLTGTSANRSGEPPACSAVEVQNQFNQDLDLILDTGPTPGGRPSTLLEIGESVRILRHGPISRREIEDVLASQGFRLVSEEGSSLL